MEACKLQRHHLWTSNEVSAGRAGVVILLSTLAAQLTWNWLEITMGHAKGYRSGVMCVCDCKVLIGY